MYLVRRRGGASPYARLGIDRSDLDGRARQMRRKVEFFGAPHVAILSTGRDLGVAGAVDCGGYLANLPNVATAPRGD